MKVIGKDRGRENLKMTIGGRFIYRGRSRRAISVEIPYDFADAPLVEPATLTYPGPF